MFLASRARPVRKADNLTAVCEPIGYTMWDPQHLTKSTASYGDSFSLLLFTFLRLNGVTVEAF
jgi:hypothetical protein